MDPLGAILADLKTRLCTAANSRNSPMHTAVVATADADLRIMVLREFASDTNTLRFHTDARSPKVAAIKADPRVGVLFYDKQAKVQIRCRGSGRIERTGPVADAAWAASDNFARRCYLGAGPGEASDKPTSGLPERFEGVEPGDAELIAARPDFAVLLVTIEEADWFSLAHTGHRRALFDMTAGAGLGRWISP
ncbi:pyridoxamine 5'-phosphate oxidase family protein [Altererythrobacter aquiaggeris]|uniref:pyridoxamine 5'-phosphate oxidase family protein n=1 Tax=Aestuarierythrobacter aquiaggeris TaxID=1898396 RepID=UPI00301B6954